MFPGKWHLGLNCHSNDDHCHHPSTHGFNYFFGIPLTHLRDCQPGHGTVFQIYKYLPYRALGIVLATVALLHYTGFLTISRRLILGLLSPFIVVAGLITGFIMIIPYFNCVLMKDHSIVEQPFTSENLTQRMTQEAVDFIERYIIVSNTIFLLSCYIFPNATLHITLTIKASHFFSPSRNSAGPFLLFFSFLQVHTGMFASAAFRGTSDHGIYGDAVREVDWSVGRPADSLISKMGLFFLESNPAKRTPLPPLPALSRTVSD